MFISAVPNTKLFACGGGIMEDMCYERRRAELLLGSIKPPLTPPRARSRSASTYLTLPHPTPHPASTYLTSFNAFSPLLTLSPSLSHTNSHVLFLFLALAVICWSPSAQRRCYPTGRCVYRPSVTSESGLRPRNSGLKGPHTYAQPFLTSNGTWPTSL